MSLMLRRKREECSKMNKLVLVVIAIIVLTPFIFNMTKQLNDETRLLQICIETEIKIPNCNLLYGGVNTTYGEAIK
jgi:hypothetical protein